MVEDQVFDEYMQRKKKLRQLHQRLKETKDVQETYHKIMGSAEATDEVDSSSDN